MIYRIKLVSDEAPNFAREIEINSDATFMELHDAVLDSVGFKKDDITSFYICDEDWQKGKEITQVPMDTSSDRDSWVMDETYINDMIEEEGDRFMFVFDYITERAFFMELKEIIPGRSLDHAVCTKKMGNPPEQSMDLDLFNLELDAHARLAGIPGSEDLEGLGLEGLGIEGVDDFDLGDLNIEDPLAGDTISIDDVEL